MACNQVPPPEPEEAEEASGELTITEVVANNEGAWIDEWGEADDFLEVRNTSKKTLRLSRFELSDSSQAYIPLPNVSLDPGQTLLLWADDDPSQGDFHLPLKISSLGERLTVTDDAGELVERVDVPSLGVNEAYSRFGKARGDFQRCRYSSPTKQNPPECEPPEPPSLEDESFEPFELPEPYPTTTSTLVLSELALNPADFIEIFNAGDETIELDEYSLYIAPTAPGEVWPVQGAGVEITLPEGERLPPGERITLALGASDTAELALDPLFEGVVTLFERGSAIAVHRVDFMHWPEGATLARVPEHEGPGVFCENATPGEENECQVLQSRDVGDRVRHLRTPGDFRALAAGEALVGIESVKFVLDMGAGGAVHLLGGERWPLHYSFVREEINGEPQLDRCDAAQNAIFYQGWYDFSVTEYFQVEGRRYLLGTLSLHGATNLHAVEFTFGDTISAEQMRVGFYSVIPHTERPSEWVLRAQDDVQLARVREIEGSLPLVGPNAPFVGMTFQPLTRGVSFGTLRFIPATELDRATFGRDTIVVTDDVPNDIPFVAGLITEAFQTPLAHVNVLSQNRNTPNAALRAARSDPRLEPYFDQLVRLEVTPTELLVREATPKEVREFWESRESLEPPASPRLDTSVRGVQPLEQHSLASLPVIGAKAAQMSELKRINVRRTGCEDTPPFVTPEAAFAIPVVHYLEHFEKSGAKELLQELREDPDFESDPAAQADGLTRVQQSIREYPVDSELLDEVTAATSERFGNKRVRFRSSSNTEDLPTFNGAGLYTSISAELDQEDRRVDDAIRTVWASLWNPRAYDERRYSNIDDENIAMGVLVHLAELSEEANGVAVSRNVLEPNRGDIYYINVQAGEASVTNPAPGITTDQLIYRWPPRTPNIEYNSNSSVLGALLDPPAHVMTEQEVRNLSCALAAVHDWFRPKLDPNSENRWFAMETEFKLLDGDRQLLLKQARPHSFGAEAAPTDCRDF